MFSSLTTKIALKKIGMSSDTFNFSSPDQPEPKKLKKTRKDLPPGVVPGLDDEEEDSKSWPKWMTMKSLPLTVQPWLSPPPPPVAVAAECPKIGDLAPLDRDRKLTFGGGRKVLVVFLRCVGCAFAQKTFINLRALANKHANNITCIAVSHSSAAATQKWIDLMGGAWNVQVVIDEDRAIYAAWGLGLSSVWYYFNPTTQSAAWKEKGWLGATVAGAIQRSGTMGRGVTGAHTIPKEHSTGGTGVIDAAAEGPTTVMGNKWQQAGAFAVDGRGTVVWGGKARSADDVMDLELGAQALGM